MIKIPGNSDSHGLLAAGIPLCGSGRWLRWRHRRAHERWWRPDKSARATGTGCQRRSLLAGYQRGKTGEKKEGDFLSPSKRRVLGRNSEPLIRQTPFPGYADVNSRIVWAREIPNLSQLQASKHNRLNALFSASHETVTIRGAAFKARAALLITGIGRWEYGLLHPSVQAGLMNTGFPAASDNSSRGSHGLLFTREREVKAEVHHKLRCFIP
jgi:hypothetical protein